jgi:hypothetical protein
MNNVTIKKGTHAPFRIPKVIPGKYHQYSHYIVFTESCRYDLKNEDQADINKLFGIGYFPNHHENSVRFGWRYITDLDAMEIMAYWYTNKERKWNHVCFVSIEKVYQYILNITGNFHTLSVYDGTSPVGDFTIYDDVKPMSFGYLLRPYFGGNRKAPHNMTIKIN